MIVIAINNSYELIDFNWIPVDIVSRYDFDSIVLVNRCAHTPHWTCSRIYKGERGSGQLFLLAWPVWIHCPANISLANERENSIGWQQQKLH